MRANQLEHTFSTPVTHFLHELPNEISEETLSEFLWWYLTHTDRNHRNFHYALNALEHGGLAVAIWHLSEGCVLLSEMREAFWEWLAPDCIMRGWVRETGDNLFE